MHLDNSACNLASINLLKYLDVGGQLRRRRVPPHRRDHLHGPGDPRRPGRLPDAGDRRDQPRLPPARHRLRQPRRHADGARPALRLRRGSGVGRLDHVADDGPRLRHQRPHGQPHGSRSPASPTTRSTCCGCCGCTATPATPSTPPRRCPTELLAAGAGVVGHGRARRRGARRAQLPGQRARADRHDRADDGLRHDRHRARPRARQDEEAGRRGHDVDRQPDDPAGPAPPRLHHGPGRRDHRLHRRREVDHRRPAPRSGAPRRCSPARWATTRSTTRATCG